MIFADYCSGMGQCAIAKKINAMGISTRQGNFWTGQRVKEILVNEKYVGNMLLQKYYRQDPIGKRKMKNQGELPKYFVEQSHEAIISAELFEKVQNLVKKQTKQFSHPGATNRYPLSGMVQCAACGKSYQRKIYKQGAVWMCATYLRQGKSHCPTAKQISERILYEKICSALQIKEFDVKIVKSKIENILVSPNWLTFLFKDNTEKAISWKNYSRSESWTPEMRQAAAERSRKCQK